MSQNPWARPQQPDDEHPYWQYQSDQYQSDQSQPDQSQPDQSQPHQSGTPVGDTTQPVQQPHPQQAHPQSSYPQSSYPQSSYEPAAYPWQPGQPTQASWAGPTGTAAASGAPAWQSAPPPVGAPAQPYVVAPSPRQDRAASVLGGTPATWTIIGICMLVWIGELLSPGFFNDVALTPYQGRSEPWRFVTSAFAHSLTITHIGFNMYALWTLRMLEPYLGRARFVATYLLCAIAGGAAVVLLSSPHHMGWYTQVVGASGAIFGLFGALIFALRDVRASTNQLWVVIGINLAISFTVPNIAWQAHVGGFLVGMLAGWLLVRERRHRLDATAPDRSWMWLGVLFVGVVAAVVLKYVVSPAVPFP